MEVHPVCDLFPEMSRDQFAGLVRDIAVNGLREPIVTYRGAIIDGRHRARACNQVNVEPRYREWDGRGDLAAYVVALNLHRRHLDKSQRAMIADKVATFKQGERTDLQPSAHVRKVSHADAARLMNVSERLVESASVVRGQGVPELTAMVEDGSVALRAAEEIARLPEPVQEDVVAHGPEAVKRLAADRRAARKESPAPRKSKPPVARASDQFWSSIKMLLKDMVHRRDADDMARLRELRDQIDAVLNA